MYVNVCMYVHMHVSMPVSYTPATADSTYKPNADSFYHAKTMCRRTESLPSLSQPRRKRQWFLATSGSSLRQLMSLKVQKHGCLNEHKAARKIKQSARCGLMLKCTSKSRLDRLHAGFRSSTWPTRFHSSAPVLAAQPQSRTHGCSATSVDRAVAVQQIMLPFPSERRPDSYSKTRTEAQHNCNQHDLPPNQLVILTCFKGSRNVVMTIQNNPLCVSHRKTPCRTKEDCLFQHLAR